MKPKTKGVIALISAIGMMPISVLADDIGIGRPNIDPDSTEPTPIESENTWWNELLEKFEVDSE